MKREYKRILEGDVDIFEINKLGSQGWELVSISPGEIPIHNVLYFRRPI